MLSAELELGTSRHLPDVTCFRVPVDVAVHCWAAAPVQSAMTTSVPLAVPPPLGTTHLPRIFSAPVDGSAEEAESMRNFCALEPLQV